MHIFRGGLKYKDDVLPQLTDVWLSRVWVWSDIKWIFMLQDYFIAQQ